MYRGFILFLSVESAVLQKRCPVTENQLNHFRHVFHHAFCTMLFSGFPFEFCSSLCFPCKHFELFNLCLPLSCYLKHQKYCIEVRSNKHDHKLNLTGLSHHKWVLILVKLYFENCQGNLGKAIEVVYKWSMTQVYCWQRTFQRRFGGWGQSWPGVKPDSDRPSSASKLKLSEALWKSTPWTANAGPQQPHQCAQVCG